MSSKRDIYDEIAILLHPDDLASADEPAVEDEIVRLREGAATELRNASDLEGRDPVLLALYAAWQRRLAAEQDMRRLIAYAREFVRPRPYKLIDLARSCGMSISGIRTAYAQDEIDEVSRALKRRTVR